MSAEKSAERDRWLDQQTAGDGPNDYADRCDCCGTRSECGCEIALESYQEEVIRDERGVVTRSVEIVVCRTHRCELGNELVSEEHRKPDAETEYRESFEREALERHDQDLLRGMGGYW